MNDRRHADLPRRRRITAARIGYWLAVIALIGIVLLAWCAIPDCDRPYVCGL